MKKRIYIDCGLLCAAWLFVTVFSYTTSPLYHAWGNVPDSPIFQIVGKYWAEGYVPYKDLWDMKGPFIFLVNAAGYGLTGTRLGVYLMQCVSLFLTLSVIYRTFALRLASGRSFLLTLLSLAGLSYVYEGGNLTEEYILFPLSLSFYYIIRWTDSYEERHAASHPPQYAVIYGVVLGLSLMSRLTNALGLCSAVGVVVVALLRRGEYKNLLANIGMFILGFGVATVPFVVYFHHHGALQDMWDAAFLFALRYAGNAQKDLSETGIHYFVLSYLNSIVLMAVSAVMVYRLKAVTVRTSIYLFSAAVPFLWFCQGNGYGHYGMTVYPLFALAVTEIACRKQRLLLSALSLMLFASLFSKVHFMHVMYHWENREIAECRQFLGREPSLDYASFVAYNCDPSLYLDLDVLPAVPVFSLQEMGRDRIPEWRHFLSSLYRERQPEWILVSRAGNKQTLIIQPLLDEDYQMVLHDGKKQLELYKRLIPR